MYYKAAALFVLTFAVHHIAIADEATVRLLEKLKPAVVMVETDRGLGSGFVVSADTIVTNYHVIESVSKVQVKFSNGESLTSQGTLLVDKDRDLALLSVKQINRSIVPLEVNKELPKQGQDVIALGTPRGFEFSVTRGIVSGVRTASSINTALGRESLAGTWVQTDAAISPGNSGGPLVDQNGKVIGMNTFCRTDSQNLNFAISSIDIQNAILASKVAKVTAFLPSPRGTPDLGTNELNHSLVKKGFAEAAKQRIKRVNDRDLRALGKDDVAFKDLELLFSPEGAVSIKPGAMVRVKGESVVIQVLKDGALVEIDGVRCLVVYTDGQGGEVRAKVGDDIVKVSVDSLYLAGKPTEYLTRGGNTSFYIPILPISTVPVDVWKDTLASIVKEEVAARAEAKVVGAKADLERYLQKIRRKFKASAGDAEVDAVAVSFDGETLELLRMDTNKVIAVRLDKLSQDDAAWVDANKAWIKVYGPKVRAVLSK